MKLIHEYIENKINLSNEEKINILIIENQALFTEIITDIYNQINNEIGKVKLQYNYENINISKNLELIINFIDLKINKRELINKLMKEIDIISIDEKTIMKTNEIKSTINEFVLKISENIDFNIDFDIDYDISYILKAINFKFKEDYQNISEKLIEYMLLIREFDRDKCFVLVNIRDYISDSDINNFYKTILYNKLKVLIISATDCSSSNYELKTIIDKDLCEI